ncbi:MAG: hypothetical protein FJ095_01215 [Deltaproteobacteria bacterium]|nr:hypothetical protein [Deltaproteobacteria bacterium]
MALRLLVLVPFLAFAGCNPRADECNRLIAVMNAAEDGLDGTERQADAAGIRRFAGDLDAVAARLDTVELKLEPLREFRERYRKILADYARALRTLADAQDTADGTKLRATVEDGNALERDSHKLIGELNDYCGGK